MGFIPSIALGLFGLLFLAVAVSGYTRYRGHSEPISYLPSPYFNPFETVDRMRSMAYPYGSAVYADLDRRMELRWVPELDSWRVIFNGRVDHKEDLDQACAWLVKVAENTITQFPAPEVPRNLAQRLTIP